MEAQTEPHARWWSTISQHVRNIASITPEYVGDIQFNVQREGHTIAQYHVRMTRTGFSAHSGRALTAIATATADHAAFQKLLWGDASARLEVRGTFDAFKSLFRALERAPAPQGLWATFASRTAREPPL